jgi:hypothetical protein
MFLVSGMIPRVTTYGKGVLNGMKFENKEKDNGAADERSWMYVLKIKDSPQA